MKSYLRFLSRNKLYTAIEVVGLSLALAFLIPCISFYTSLREIKEGHENYQNIYGICADDCLTSNPALGEVLITTIPEIERVTSPILDDRKKKVNDSKKIVHSVDKDFFYFFPCTFKEGDANFIEIDGAAAISAEFAAALAPDGQALGLDLTYDSKTYTVRAVFDDYGRGVLKNCDMMVSNKDKIESNRHALPYRTRGSLTFISVNPSADIADVSDKFQDIATEFWGNIDKNYRNEKLYKLLRYDKLTTGYEAFIGIKSYHIGVQIVIGALCILLFLISLLNFINLNVSLTTKRAKEMAMRKLNGAERSNILTKYCLESIGFTALCFIIGLVGSIFTSNILSNFASGSLSTHIDFSIKWTIDNIIIYIGTLLITGLISGLTPAAITSHFTPLDVTKGEFRYHRKKFWSKLFIGFQSILAAVLLSSTILLETQYKNMQKVEYNCDIDDVFYFNSYEGFSFENMYNQLQGKPEILKVGKIKSGIPVNALVGSVELDDAGEIPYSYIVCDENAFDVIGFQVMEDYSTGSKNGLWTTPALQKAFEEHPGLIEKIMDKAGFSSINIVGQIQKFPTFSYYDIDGWKPMVYVRNLPDEDVSALVIKTIPDHTKARRAIADAYTDVCGKDVKDLMSFDGDEYSSAYIKEYHLKQLDFYLPLITVFRTFTIIVILLCMMGLIGTSIHFASEQTHEIAVRKLFGGSVHSETRRTILRYFRMTLISSLLSTPIIFLIFRIMTERTVDKVESTWWIYILTFAILFFLSLTAVFWQTLRGALTNPADALKKE